jgi:hypothetical protein
MTKALFFVLINLSIEKFDDIYIYSTGAVEEKRALECFFIN